MAYDFPNAPTIGQQVVTSAGVVYTWDGVAWRPASTGGAPYAPLNSPIFTGDARAVTPAFGDSDTSIATSAFVQSAVSPTYDNVGRNLLHNPLMAVAQRGTGPWTSLPGPNVYTADRWCLSGGTDTINVSLVAAADFDRAQIGDENATRYYYDNFTGNAAAGAAHSLQQPIEGIRRLGGKTVTISFWAVASVATLKLGINLYQNPGSGGSPSAARWVLATGQAVNLTTTWTRYSTTIAIPSTAGLTLGTNADDRTILVLAFSSGATNSAVLGVGVQSGTISLWGAQLEVNNVATPLDYAPPGDQLRQCQRFYQIGTTQRLFMSGGVLNSDTILLPFPVTMRAQPAMTSAYSTQVGGTGGVNPQGAYGYQLTTNVTATAGNQVNVYGTWTASADL